MDELKTLQDINSSITKLETVNAKLLEALEKIAVNVGYPEAYEVEKLRDIARTAIVKAMEPWKQDEKDRLHQIINQRADDYINNTETAEDPDFSGYYYTLPETMRLLHIGRTRIHKLVSQNRLTRAAHGVYTRRSVDRYKNEQTLKRQSRITDVNPGSCPICYQTFDHAPGCPIGAEEEAE